MKHLYCDYLVVGAGTANLSFLDSLLEHHPTATAILIDRNAIPGGHWTTAYPFVRLHQPACWYGVNSMKLGTSRNALGDEIFDNSDRSSSREILSYYAKVVDNFVATKRVRTFFNTEHTELDDDGLKRHVITTPNGEFLVQCAKVVRCETRVIVPSMREVPFPVDQSVTAKSLNHIPDALESGLYSKFLVIGAGKTGTDAIVHLLSSGVNEKDITWIISRDVWYAMRDGLWPSTPGSGKDFYKCNMETMDILARAPSLKEAVLEMEREGQFARLDPNGPAPAVFKGPTIDKDELALARSVRNVVRLGRVRCINDNQVVLDGGVLAISSKDTLVVDCMAEDMYGYADFDVGFKIFNPDRIRLGPVTHVFNPSLTSALVGYLEGTFHDDSVKNSFLYFPAGKNLLDMKPEMFFLSLVAQLYTTRALRSYKPALKFLMKSRTAQEAPAHHGGWPLFIWYMIGPNGLKRRSDEIMEKFQSGGFSDYTDLFVDWPNEGALDPRTIKAALRASASPERRKERHECPSLASDTTPEEETFKQDGYW